MSKTEHVHRMARMQSYFRWDHLPAELAIISKPFAALADALIETGLQGKTYVPEMEVALRKLLEAKDAAVRARLVCWQEECKEPA